MSESEKKIGAGEVINNEAQRGGGKRREEGGRRGGRGERKNKNLTTEIQWSNMIMISYNNN